ncbi:hypothetical protein BO82DRAFT_12539 [Aspergillus uvarum CBS 121591]|uniref:Uncharacterized protein n=1 Tax=Aspergillus uvarum CBS 121591 TaxID=1448315 RepID=A0A319BW68_9EURO|nr:hypothetical protein BO82DRAFT_12539 [Aspergillus uvarum CBS 121591]PYH75789.1 hypothetical protein BO82DRAFT_12539 [Aspergillus uvarum CBS 121591]
MSFLSYTCSRLANNLPCTHHLCILWYSSQLATCVPEGTRCKPNKWPAVNTLASASVWSSS